MNSRLRRGIDRLAAPLLAIVPPLAVAIWAMPQDLTPWRSAAIVSAWAGTAMLVSSLLLMLRSSRIAGLLGGLEQMYRWHHRSGLTAYLLLLVHPLALAMDGWSESPGLAWLVLAPWEQAWPVWLGWCSLVLLMTGLAASLAVQLSYRLWRRLHPVLGLAVVLGLLHVYTLLGQAWPLLALACIATLALGGRLLFSDLDLAALPYRVQRIVQRTAGMIELELAPCAGSLAPAPGQFVLLRFDDGIRYRACGEHHPFTVCGTYPGGIIRLAIKSLGPCSQRIQGIEPGVLALVQGPFGNFLQDAPQRPLLWIAGGIGITPFLARLRAGPCQQPTTLMYLYRTAEDAPFLTELHAISASDPALQFSGIATGDSCPDFHALFDSMQDIQQREVYLCGPPGMLHSLMPHVQRLHPHAVHAERFTLQ